MDNDYIRPMVTDYGTVQDITAGNQDGDALDQDFPVETPKKLLTFS